MSETTKARQLSDSTLNAILDHYPDLKEVKKEGDVYQKLFNQQKEEKGAMRLFHGDKIERLVYVGEGRGGVNASPHFFAVRNFD